MILVLLNCTLLISIVFLLYKKKGVFTLFDAFKVL